MAAKPRTIGPGGAPGRAPRRRGGAGDASRGGAGTPRHPMRRFVTRFLLAAALLFALYQLSEAARLFRWVNAGNAVLSGALLDLAGIETRRAGTQLGFPRGGMEIISECSAVYVGILFAAGVLAFPAGARARLLGLAAGLPILFALNVVRLVTLGLVVHWRPGLLPFVHVYLWQVCFVLAVAALFLIWIERIVPRAGSRG